MRACNRNVTHSKNAILDLIIRGLILDIPSKEMSHDFVRVQSMAETCSRHWGYGEW